MSLWRLTRTALLAAGLLAAGAWPARAQQPPHWRFFTSSDGLRESWIEDVTESPSGRVWIAHGAVDALTVYDGYAFTSIPTPGHPLKVREGPSGQAWALLPGPELHSYAGLQLLESGRWQRFPIEGLAGSGMARWHFLPWAHDRVLLLRPDALLEFNRATHAVRTVRTASETPLARFTDLAPAADGGAWVGGPGGLLHVLSAGESRADHAITIHALPGRWRAARMTGLHPRAADVHASVALDGAWASLRFDGRQWTEVARTRSSGESVESWGGRGGEIWTAYVSPSHYRLELRQRDCCVQAVGAAKPLSGRLNAVDPLPDGGFWLATSVGLVRHAPAAWRTPPDLLDLPGPVGSIYAAAAGDLYALHESGLLRLADGRWRLRPLPDGLRADVGLTTNIGEIDTGELAMGVNETVDGADAHDAVLLFDSARESFRRLRHPRGLEVRLLGVTRGGLWVITRDGDRAWLERYDRGQFTSVLDAGARWATGPPRQLLELGGQGLLLVPEQGGVGWLRNGRYTAVGPAEGYPGTGPFAALAVDASRFWFGDRDSVIAFDGRRWETLRAGLQTVRAMMTARDGTRWVASGAGLQRYRDGSWIPLATPDGLPDGAAYDVLEDAAGRVWVSTTVGLTMYVPDADRDPPRTSLDVPGNPTEAPPNGDVQIVFSGRDRWNYTTPDRLLYAWRLDGGPWSELQSRAAVALHGLSAGRHRLDVRAADRNGNVDPAPASLEFVVLLPWYRESGFLAVGAFGVTALLLAIALFVSRHFALERIVKERTRELAEANAQLRTDLAERQRFEEERARLEEQLHQAQKLEAVGRLAGGISHDFNNLLTVISGYAESVREDLPPDAPLRPAIDEIAKAAERAAGLTRQLMAFSRHRLIAPQVLDLNVVVADIERMLRRLIGEHITLVVRPGAHLWRVLADRGQLEQVIVNLAVNARDAMAATGGTLTIETSNAQLDETFVRSHAGTHAGPHVRLAVSDDGIGMDDETRARIFEPFFTTKARDKGSGLGLPTAYGIVAQAGGHIWVESEPGRGTRFTIYLPRTEAIDAGTGQARAVPAQSGKERILLVEDDDGVREVASKVLAGFGYVVEAVSSAEIALERLETTPDAYDLVLSDIVLAGMSGPAFAERARLVRPRLRIMFMSGYADDRALGGGASLGTVPFIQKPFTADALARKVRATLDAPAP